jgi:hypothetical protein
MSFGFSVGDIILVSQIAYKLHTSVTAGRHAASKDLKELGDVLFGLRCSLNHLGNVAEEIFSSATDDARGADARGNLDAMIRSCGDTLEELDKLTRKYRDAAGIPDGDENGACVGTGEGVKRSKMERLKVNWRKIRWDAERHSLSEYRVKLQSHTDAINILLNAFLWCVLASNRYPTASVTHG